MDLHLPLLADINLHVGVAEEACEEQAFTTARNNLDKAEASFQELRELWPDIDASRRGLLTAMVGPLRKRYDAVMSALPAVAVISDGAAEPDEDEDVPPVE